MAEPDPPDVANYVVEALGRQDAEDLRALAEYCRELADYRQRSVDPDEVEGEVVTDDVESVLDELDAEAATPEEVASATGGVVVEKTVPCGPGCSGCPHGPYLYLNYRDGSGSVRTKYLGKPGDPSE